MSSNFKARTKLYRAKKKPEESIKQWVTRLENLVDASGFDQQKRISIFRDIFVIGLGYSPIKKKLYKKIDENNKISHKKLQKIAIEEETKLLNNSINTLSKGIVKRELTVDLAYQPASKNVKLNYKDDVKTELNIKVENLSGPETAEVLISDEENKKIELFMPFNLTNAITSFQGRDEVIKKIHNIFEKGFKVIVVSGLFAIGKTQLVKKYAWDHKEYYKNNLIWITYENKKQLETMFVTLAKQLHLKYNWEKLSIQTLVNLVYSHFDNRGKFMFIYDNIPSRNLLNEYLLTDKFNNIKILITSLNTNWNPYKTINLKPMSVSESVLVFKAATKYTFGLDTLENNIKKMYGIPLLIQRFASYFAVECRSEDRQNLVVNDNNKLLNHLYETEFPNSWEYSNKNSLFKSFIATLEIVKDITKTIVHEIIVKILHFSVYYNVQVISYSLLEELINNSFFFNNNNINIFLSISYKEVNSDSENNLDILNEAIKTMEYFSLISRKNGDIIIHKIIKDLIRLKLKIDYGSIHEAVDTESGNLEEMKQLINNNKFLVYLTAYKQKHTLFHCAASKGQIHILKYLIRDLKVPINIKNGIEDTGLHLATLNGMRDAVSFLIDEGASVNVLNKDNESVLHYACDDESTASLATVKLLVKKGGEVNVKQKNGYTPLMYAARNGISKIVSFLIDNGAEIEALDNSGQNALHRAANEGHILTSMKLLEKGCSPHVKDVNGKTPLMLAESQGHHVLVKLFKEYEENASDVNMS